MIIFRTFHTLIRITFPADIHLQDFSITFHRSDFAPNGVALVPTQIYSSILDFLHYGLLLLILRSQKKDGETAAAYLIFYSAGRFVLEFFRYDSIRGAILFLSTSQWLSLVLWLLAGVLFFLGARERKGEAHAI